MKSKDVALKIAGTIFGIVAALHLLRVITGVTVIIGEWTLPMWVNMLGLIGASVLCLWLLLQSGSRD
jgi:hypothetical protein